MSPQAQNPRARVSRRRLTASVFATLLLPLAGVTALAPSATAATITSASFGGSGTQTSGGDVYVRPDSPITLTVATDGRCVDVTGAHTARQTSGSSPFVFNFTSPATEGVQQVTIKVGNGNNSSGCNGGVQATSQQYIVDGTGPQVTGALTPAPNAAGWNKGDVTVNWSATDPVGVATGPTPATATVTANGTVTKTATATDRLGNSGTGSVTVNLDKNAPTVAGTPSPAPNANGWNNSNVAVTWTCADTGGSGVTGSCPAPTTLTGNAANQTATSGVVTDLAGNTATGSVTGINIDKVAPSLSGAPTASPNANGWYKGDVTVSWTATDALSGVTKPADSIITSEGANLTASASVTDKAGNSASATSGAVKIDRTAPTTTVTAPPAWNNTDLTLTLVPNDGLSGLDKTYYKLDGGPQQAAVSVPVAGEGNHTVEFWSTDKAGNVEAAKTVTFGIDKSAPTISHAQSPAANIDGWNNSPVTVEFSCSDAVSGIAACTSPQTVSAHGASQSVTGTATDRAGNSTQDPVSVNIDKIGPVVQSLLPQPNALGWYGDDVTVTYRCDDALSGIKECPAAFTFGQGHGQSRTDHARDVAGNSTSVQVNGVNVDKTAPTISGELASQPNSNGWFKGDAVVHWTCDDNLSGVVKCPEDTIVTGEGDSLSAAASVSDKAGHTTYATVTSIKIDRSKPSTSAVDVPAAWQNVPVSVSLDAADNLSDVDATYYRVDGEGGFAAGRVVTVGRQGEHTVEYYSVDKAGNREDTKEFSVRVDLSAPSVAAAQTPEQNSNGWNNTDVTVTFTCADQPGLSGLASCPEPKTVTDEGRDREIKGTATDAAGNSATATATVNIDKTPPRISGAADRAPNAAGWYRNPVTVTFAAEDTLSGIDAVTGPKQLGEGADQSVEGAATDAAGNSAQATVDRVNIDTTPPSLSAAPTGAANANGWYNSDVTLDWACDDNLSGVAGDCPANTVFDTEGDQLVASASIKDVAGNPTSATSAPVKLDKTAPTTSASAPSGWSNGSVDVRLSSYDALSGVDATSFSVDGGDEEAGTTVTLSDEGSHEIAYRSVDKAGNVEDLKHVTVLIDKSAPTIEHTQSPAKNRNGWNKSDVTVRFVCEDQAALSGIAACTGDQTVSAEGKDSRVDGTAVDRAGNEAHATAMVSIDKTAPTIEGRRTPPANVFGWNGTDVTVHFEAEDALSGIDDVSDDATLGEGADQSVTGTATDAAGNTADATVGGVNVDKTAPHIAGAPTTLPNSNGWYKGDVVITWDCRDALSGVVGCPDNSVIEGEGQGQTASETVADRAGNRAADTSAPVNIDRTPPTTGASAPLGWNSQAVTVSLDSADGLSGVESTRYRVDGGPIHDGTSLTIASPGVHTLDYWSTDQAGNIESDQSLVVKIDLAKPAITHTLVPAPNAFGWNNGDVTVRFDCDDDLSGVASCEQDHTVTTDGENQPVVGTAADQAGNVETDSASVSIDTVKPTISGGPDRAANGNGWYGDDVTVSFTCGDALSGVKHCSPSSTLGEGGHQHVTGHARDAADNAADLAVGSISVDKTAPALSGRPTAAPNPAGWYNGDVTVAWTASDQLSGLDGPAPGDTVIDGEGVDRTATQSVSDLAGNQTSATTRPVKIDRTAPSTTVSDVSDWSNGGVTVDLTATDNLSGVKATYYELDGEQAVVGRSVVIDDEGVHTLRVWSVDQADNVEAKGNVEVKIDKTAPAITHRQDPEPNSRGWNKVDVRVTFDCTDGGSGLTGCTEPQGVSSEGRNQQVEGQAVDNAGNRSTDWASVSIDKSAPSIQGGRLPAGNGHGWSNSDVTVTFTCDDQAGLSGLLSCPAERILGEGAGQSVSGTAVDAAGNESRVATVDGINVDKTSPTLSGQPAAPSTGDDGWYNGDVTVRWQAADALSGLEGAAPAPSVVVGEGANLAASASVADKAGNTAHRTVDGIKIDRTAPVTTATAPTGWRNSDAAVTFAAADNLSGVKLTRYAVDGGQPRVGDSVLVSAEGAHVVTYWSRDLAGNEEAPKSVSVYVDKTNPTISGRATAEPNANGWYKTPVTVHFTCADQTGLSGVASCQPDETVSAQGTNAVVGRAVDNAGNTGSTAVGGIKMDTVAPVVAVTGVTDGAVYTLGAVPTPGCSASDLTSGVGQCSGAKTGGLSNGVGAFTYTATATDKAGNVGTKTVTYQVRYGYATTLFLQPVNDTAHQTGVATSVFKAGQTVPMKFELRTATGNAVQTVSAPKWLTPVRGASISAAVNEAVYADSPDSGSTYRLTGDQYLYNWNTDKSQAGNYWRVGVQLDDGQTYFVNIGLR